MVKLLWDKEVGPWMRSSGWMADAWGMVMSLRRSRDGTSPRGQDSPLGIEERSGRSDV